MSYYVVSSGGWLQTRLLLLILQHGGLIKPSRPLLGSVSARRVCVRVWAVLVSQAVIRPLIWGRGFRLWGTSGCKALV